MLKSKKYNLIEWIISVADEKVIDILQSVREKIESRSQPPSQQFSYSTSTYKELKSRKTDLEKLKKEQNYQPTSTEELSLIAKDANIEQSIDFLLTDLKAMD